MIRRAFVWLLAASMTGAPAFAKDETFAERWFGTAPKDPAGVYDVTGADGANDPDGWSAAPGVAPAHAGGGGRPGGHAEEKTVRGRLAKTGWAGGRLNLNLSVDARENIVITGAKVGPENTYHHRVTDRLKLRDTRELTFRARGGAGGFGGRGGRGQDGARGADGYDATRYNWGGNGGDGGGGGREGDSTDGGDAGQGGEITLTVPVEDMDLAMLFRELDVRGNAGGPRGVGRGVGQGGAGGAGGRAHTWVTFRNIVVPTFSSDGDGGFDVDLHETVVPVPHYNPGGADGRRGTDGAPSTHVTRDGADSADGKFRFGVRDAHGVVTHYDGVYDLRLLPGFTLHGSHNHGEFFEPGETVTINNLRVINVGLSPTPVHQRVRLFLSDNAEWIRGDGLELTLPRSLAPGEAFDFGAGELRFHLAEKTRFAAGRLEDVDFVVPRARVARVEHEFERFDQDARRAIRVRYPVQITPLQSLVTIAPGEAKRVLVKATNVSTQTIGRRDDRPDLRRAETRVRRTGGSLRAPDFVLSKTLDHDGTDPARGIADALEGLAPGKSVLIEAFVGVRNNAQNYASVTLQPELHLESILNPNDINRVQFEPFELRVSRAFEHDEGADVLLVANHGLDARVLEAFEATAALKQLRMNIWDFSRYGFFDFAHRLDEYGPIFEAYRGKTIVVLGNPARGPTGDVCAPDLLSPDQIVAAARRYGIKVVVVDASDDPAATVARLTEPAPLDPRALRDPNDLREFRSPRHYAREFKRAIHEVQEALGDVTSFLGISRVAVTVTPLLPWRTPESARLRNAARDALAVTERFAPEARVFVDYEFEPKVIGRRFGLWKRWSVGHLRLRRSVDESKTSVVAIQMPPDGLNDPEFILGEEFQTAFDFALNFDTKLRIFNDVILGKYDPRRGEVRLPKRFAHLRAREPMDYARALTHSLLLDLLHEQITIRPLDRRAKVPTKDLWTKLDLLKKFTHYDYTQFRLDPRGEEGRAFVDLVVAMRFFNNATTTAWDRWFSFGLARNRRAARVTDRMLDRLTNVVFADVPKANEIIRARVRELGVDAKAAGVTREGLVDFLDTRGLAGMVKRDAQVHRDAGARVRDEDRQRELHHSERARRRTARSLAKAVRRDTARLRLSPAECERLLGGTVVPLRKVAAP